MSGSRNNKQIHPVAHKKFPEARTFEAMYFFRKVTIKLS